MYIDIVSDLICPWCFIGKRRLDSVLATPVGKGVIPRWRRDSPEASTPGPAITPPR